MAGLSEKWNLRNRVVGALNGWPPLADWRLVWSIGVRFKTGANGSSMHAKP